MILEGDFIYNGMQRWNIGWATPNYAGAFLATLLPWCWMIGGRRRKRGSGRDATVAMGVGLGIETVGYFLLTKTYSRGALVAFATGAAFYAAALGWRQMVASWRAWTLRLLLVTACAAGTGFANRLQPSAIAEDGAVNNRLELWHGGLQMVAASPWRGWGAGESGRAYMNWFQDMNRTEGYATMVNSYLHVGVEYGLPVLGAVIAILTALLIWAWRTARGTKPDAKDRSLASRLLHEGDVIAAAAGASLIAWAVANVFSTLWIEPKLWIVPVASVLVVVTATVWRRDRRWWLALISGVVAGTAGASLLWLAGIHWNKQCALRIEPQGDEVVLVSPKRPATETWHVWPDTDVLGRTPGKEIRRWLGMPGTPGRVVVHSPFEASPAILSTSTTPVILFGRQMERLGRDGVLGTGQIFLVHPMGRTPDAAVTTSCNVYPNLAVILPEIDEVGLNAAWRLWAQGCGARIVVSPGMGTDIRAAWPAVMHEASERQASR